MRKAETRNGARSLFTSSDSLWRSCTFQLSLPALRSPREPVGRPHVQAPPAQSRRSARRPKTGSRHSPIPVPDMPSTRRLLPIYSLQIDLCSNHGHRSKPGDEQPPLLLPSIRLGIDGQHRRTARRAQRFAVVYKNRLLLPAIVPAGEIYSARTCQTTDGKGRSLCGRSASECAASRRPGSR